MITVITNAYNKNSEIVYSYCCVVSCKDGDNHPRLLHRAV